MKVSIVVGTRPQIIKTQPIIKEPLHPSTLLYICQAHSSVPIALDGLTAE